jgi:hypothetical protein
MNFFVIILPLSLFFGNREIKLLAYFSGTAPSTVDKVTSLSVPQTLVACSRTSDNIAARKRVVL